MRCVAVFAAMFLLSVSMAFAADPAAEQQKVEIINKADALFTNRYKIPPGKQLRFDRESESGPPDEVIYSFNGSYIVEVEFASDGSVAKVGLAPEVLLYSNERSDIPESVVLDKGDAKRFVENAKQLRAIGNPEQIVEDPPLGCFQSGQNLYCGSSYEDATVAEFCLVRNPPNKPERILPKWIQISYRQFISGLVSKIKVSEDEYRLKIGRVWYVILKEDNEQFLARVAVGSVVNLTSYGCAGNEFVCDAAPTQAQKH